MVAYKPGGGGRAGLAAIVGDLPRGARVPEASPRDHNLPPAVIMVKSFSGFGIHEVLSIHRLFPRVYKNFIFVSAAVVDSGSFKGAAGLERLEEETRPSLEKYVAWARGQGIRADDRIVVGTAPGDTVP